MSRTKRASVGTALASTAVAVVVGVYSRRRAEARRIWGPPSGALVRTSALSARVLGDHGPPVVLLHGLVASGLYWGAAFDRLAHGRRLIVPDLLGFGHSQGSPGGYGPDDHVAAVISCLDELGVGEPAVVGAHSLGALVALRLAATHPARVRSIVAFGPPLYPDAASALAHVTATSPMARLFVLPGRAAEAACAWVCRHQSLAGRIAVLTHPGLPAPVAADGVRHTWASYSESLSRLLLAGEAPGWLDRLQCPVRLVAGDDDPVVDHRFLSDLATAHDHVSVERWDGDHHLPLTHAQRCVDLIRDALEPWSGAGSAG